MIQGNGQWNYRHYEPIIEYGKQTIHLDQVVPRSDGFSLYWDDDFHNADNYGVSWKDIQTGQKGSIAVTGHNVTVDSLIESHEYRVRISGEKGQKSASRLVRCGEAPGTVINYLHPRDNLYGFSGHFLASPSIVKLPSGKLLVSMDVFQWHGGQNLTLLFESNDSGMTWHHLTELFPCFWGALFVHKDVLYMLSMSTEYGDLNIGSSRDEGLTWTSPVRLFSSSCNGDVGGLHKAPLPIIEAEGRLMTALDYGSWETGGLRQALLFIDASADLLDPTNWTLSDFYDPGQQLMDCEKIVGGGLEGNVILGPDNIVYDLLRLQSRGEEQCYGKALILQSDKASGQLSYLDVVDFNGGSNSKFFVVSDKVSKLYWAVANEIIDPKEPDTRKVLSLYISDDLRRFRCVHRIVDFSEGDSAFVAAQYPSVVIDDDDLLVVSRTACNGADSYHNSNYITFHRVRHFRRLAH